MSDLARRIPVAKLTAQAQPLRLSADEATRRAITERFDLLAVDRLEADLEIAREGAGARLTGRITAAVVQACVVSGEPVPTVVDESVSLRFEEPTNEDELELAEDALDTLAIEDGMVDVGEAVIQSLVLALEPYPRADQAALDSARTRLMSEEEAAEAEAQSKQQASPFAKLKRP